jgi:hypothetical protein
VPGREADLPEGHTIPTGPVRHADSEAADQWYADFIEKLTAAGYAWLGFDMDGGAWSHSEHGDLHVIHGISNSANRCDTAIFSSVRQGCI